MGKSRKPRKRKDPALENSAAEEPVLERQGEAKELVPRPSQEPVRLQPVLSQWLDALRAVAGKMIDIADAAADALTKRLEGRA